MQIPNPLGPYQIERKLGGGGFADVYLAFDARRGRQVALKVLHPQHAGGVTLKRFQREAQQMLGLRHPHIVGAYDAGEIGGHHYIAMPYMAGGSLADLLQRQRPVDLPTAARIVTEVAAALDFMHPRVIHRDLKPSNILFDPQGHAHVADFGIAHVDDLSLITQSGQQMGTPHYMAPEQVLPRLAPISPATDTWALSVILYEMLCGRAPFNGENSQAVLYQVTHETPVQPTALNPLLPKELNTLLLRALTRNPRQRYQRAGDLARDLRQIAARTETGSQAGSVASVSGAAPLPRLWAVLGGASAFVLLILALLLGRSPVQPTPTPTPMLTQPQGPGLTLTQPTWTPASLPSTSASATTSPSGTASPTNTVVPSHTPSPTPLPGLIVFASDRNGFAHIFTVDGNRNHLRTITSGQEYFWDPMLTEDGSQLAFVSKINGNTEIFVARSDGSNRHAISNHPALDDHPAWFPGGKELAFASQRDGPWEIYRMNIDGSNVLRLTHDGGDNRFVAVAPDGTRIAYVSQGGAYPTVQLMVMNADGSNPYPVLTYASYKQRDDPGRFIYRPDWAPDGTLLAFGADDNDDGMISVLLIDPTNGQTQRLIEDGNSPAWSPDGGRLIYKPAGARQILFVADAAGKKLYQLTNSQSNAWSPDWAR